MGDPMIPMSGHQVAESFVSKFHSLPGITTQEKQKSLYQLLQENSALDHNTLNQIITELVPKTYLETIFRLEFLIYFRRALELYDVLLEGNEVFVAKILKHNWFFDQIFKQLGPEELVNEGFPKLSYCNRMKVLSKLSKIIAEEEFDCIFDVVLDRYGVKIATFFITGCSVAKISEVLQKHPVRLTNRQLRKIYLKNDKIINKYFEEYEKHTHKKLDLSDFEGLADFLLMQDLRKFDEFRKDQRVFSVGRRRTKKILLSKKDEIINDPERFKDHVKLNTVIRKLNEDDSKALLKNLIRKEIEFLSFNTIKGYLSYYPKKNRYGLLTDVLDLQCGKTVDEQYNMICEELLAYIPEPLRGELTNIKINSGRKDYIKFLNTKESIEKLKENINLTSVIEDRKKYILDLVETCQFNKDSDALLTVLKYYCERHKNEDEHTQTSCLRMINGFGLRNLNEEMWKYVNEIITVCKLKFGRKPIADEEVIYLEFLFKNNKPVDELLKVFFESHKNKLSFATHCIRDDAFGKYFLDFAVKIASEISDNEKDLRNFHCDIIREMDKRNISFEDYPRLLESFKERTAKPNKTPGLLKDIFKKIVFDTNHPERSWYLQVYWNNFRHYAADSDVIWFLRNEPQEIATNFDRFIAKAVSMNNSEVWYKIKTYSHLELDERVLCYCMTLLKKKSSGDKHDHDFTKNLVECVSRISSSAGYMEFTKPYIPESRKLDIENTKTVEIYEVQCHLAKFFKHVGDYQKTLPVLWKFSTGDYFGSALQSLSTSLYRIPGKDLQDILEEMAKAPVSVRKHALFFALELCTLAAGSETLRKFAETEQNISVQKHIFKSSLRYFCHNPTEECFDVVKATMERIERNDDESLHLIPDLVDKVPKKYEADYLHHAWYFLEKKLIDPDREVTLKDLKTKIVSSIHANVIPRLSVDFCLHILNKHLKRSFELERSIVIITPSLLITLIGDLLVHHPEWMQISQYVLETINTMTKKTRLQFFKLIHRQLMKLGAANLEMLKIQCDYWHSKIDPVENFDCYVDLFFIKMKINTRSGDVDQFTLNVSMFIPEMIVKYGQSVIEHIAEGMERNIEYFTTQVCTNYDFLEDLLKKYPTTPVSLLVMNQVASSMKSCMLDDSTYDHAILKLLRQVPDVEVKVTYNIKFKNQY